MKRKIFKSSVVATAVAITLLAGMTIIAYAHDPSATTSPNLSHIHIKGRITTPEGTGIAGARVGVWPWATMFPGLPTQCYYGEMTGATGSDGNFEFIIFLKTEPQLCREAFDRITIDKTQLKWIKEGYDIKPR